MERDKLLEACGHLGLAARGLWPLRASCLRPVALKWSWLKLPKAYGRQGLAALGQYPLSGDGLSCPRLMAIKG